MTPSPTDPRVSVAAPTDIPGPAGPYSSAIIANGFAFLCGQGPLLPDGTIERGTIREQTRLTLSNLDAMAAACGTSLGKAVKVTVYLSDIADWAEMNVEYALWFGEMPPVRTVVACSLNGFDIEIDATLVV